MHDEQDLHEPEHDHLLDHEFYDADPALQDEVDPMYDPADEEEDDVDWDEGVDTLDDL
ncbi:hypothetical protein D3C77_16530 [compost metagenome]|jgi:hypothetical protein|uniref:hypothetical protein n=1 Tax=Pseudomonas TaxID=286 RepID=UPI00040D6FB1|nr:MULTISPECIES: hypothetical protein [Pseudomonas]MCW2271009.1 hypothetical protein [Pseudomonas sp. JUb96]